MSLTTSVNELVQHAQSLERQFSALEQENRRLKDRYSNKKKLTTRDVQRMREMYARKRFNQAELAEMFDVGTPTVSRIVRGIYWK